MVGWVVFSEQFEGLRPFILRIALISVPGLPPSEKEDFPDVYRLIQ